MEFSGIRLTEEPTRQSRSQPVDKKKEAPEDLFSLIDFVSQMSLSHYVRSHHQHDFVSILGNGSCSKEATEHGKITQ